MATPRRRRVAAAHRRGSDRRWSRRVTTTSTHPPRGIFSKGARTIARSLGSKRVSPKGKGSGVRMIQFFINRAGKNLSPSRKRTLESAKHILQRQMRQAAR